MKTSQLLAVGYATKLLCTTAVKALTPGIHSLIVYTIDYDRESLL